MILAAGSWPRFLIFLETHFLFLLLQENLSFAERQKFFSLPSQPLLTLPPSAESPPTQLLQPKPRNPLFPFPFTQIPLQVSSALLPKRTPSQSNCFHRCHPSANCQHLSLGTSAIPLTWFPASTPAFSQPLSKQ